MNNIFFILIKLDNILIHAFIIIVMAYNLLRNIRVLHRSFEEIPEQQAHLCSTPRVCQNLSPK